MTTENTDKGQTQPKRTAKGIALWAMVRRSDDHFTGEAHELKREYGETPNGNPLNGRWVLRDKAGAFLDWDKYSNDLAERHGLDLYSSPNTKVSGPAYPGSL